MPASRELVSVVVPCWNQKEFTRLCLDALRRFSTPPWELIAVDNGSTDGTADFLDGFRAASAAPVTVLRNDRNLGFPAACNQGLAAARGAYVVFLNNDAVPTSDWLEQLVALADSGPDVGLAGPMSNLARPPQRVEGVSYRDLDGLVRFAAEWRARHLGRWREVDDLGGPCLLLTRRALEAIGGPAGAVEGGGLVARARAAGFRPAVACDLFVHRGPLPPARIARMEPAEFARRFGVPDTARALLGYTLGPDAHAVLALLAHVRPLRILEVGTALGHMTANLTEWSPDEANVFSLGIVRGMDPGGAPEQRVEAPAEADFGRHAGHFGKADKVTFVRADSRAFDFASLAPLDFAFIDGGHDPELAANDTRGAYAALAPGGWLAWHDFDSPHAWIGVREAIESLGLPEAVHHVAGTEVAFLRKAGPGPDPLSPPATSSGPIRLTWEGDWRGRHSLGLINRALGRALLDLGHDLGLDPGGPPPVSDAERSAPEPRLEARAGRAPEGGPPEVRVVHRWPPRLVRPPEARWVFFQPWEFGSLPRAWMPALAEADEVWAYSRSVREAYLDAGVPPGRVHVVPLGIDPDVFRPGLEPASLPPGPDVRFLFVGGTIWRKGIDLLLAAFARAFRPVDGVGLVVQDMGASSFYRGQTAGAAVAALRDRGYPVEYREQSLDPAALAALYAACDCAVQPYRGEGFALPVIEAMACGLPAIVTGAGPVLDYAGAGTAYLVPARRAALPGCRVGELETVGRPWVWEPDVEALADRMRRVAEDLAAARAVGASASAWVRGHFTWGHAAAAAEARLRELAARPPRRGGR